MIYCPSCDRQYDENRIEAQLQKKIATPGNHSCDKIVGRGDRAGYAQPQYSVCCTHDGCGDVIRRVIVDATTDKIVKNLVGEPPKASK